MISILMPFRNAELWIGDTLESILSQDYQNWELIAVNDHSEDQSEAILRSFKDERINLYNNTGKGIITALQSALKHANGRFITRMDADDIMPTNRLLRFAEMIDNSAPKTVVTGHVRYFSKGAVSAGYLNYQNWLNERCEQNDHFKHIYRECVVASPNWICRKEELEVIGLFDSLEYPEDYDLVFGWYRNGFTIKALSEETLFWREHPERTSRNSPNYQQAAFFNLKLKRFLEIDYDSEDRILLIGRGQKMKLCKDFFKSQNIQVQTLEDKVEFDLLQLNSMNCTKLLIAFYPDTGHSALNNLLAAGGFELGTNAWFL